MPADPSVIGHKYAVVGIASATPSGKPWYLYCTIEPADRDQWQRHYTHWNHDGRTALLWHTSDDYAECKAFGMPKAGGV